MAAQSQRSLKFWVCPQNYAVLKKKTRKQFWNLTSDTNRTWKVPCETHVLFIWEVKTQNCSRVFFFEHRIILMTNSKFQTPLTLNSPKSGLKNHRIKNYHIFGSSRTSVFIWDPRIPHENFCIGVICKNAKKYRFSHFPCHDGEKK